MFGSEYSALYAKVKSWSRVFLSRKDLEGLAGLVPEALYDSIGSRMVKPVEKIFTKPDQPAAAEQLLKEQLYGFIYSAKRYAPSAMQDFLACALKRFEIENLKIACRALFYGHEIKGLYRLEPRNRYQIENMKNLKSLADLQEYLSGSEYFRIAQDTFPRIEESGNTFFFEINLDNLLASRLAKKAETLPASDRKVLRETLLAHFQGERFLWAGRCRFLYGFSTEGTLALLPNHFKLVSSPEYLRILSITDAGEYYEALKKRRFISEGSNDPETALWINTMKKGRKSFGGGPFGPGVLFGFWLLYLVFIRNLTTLLEGQKMEWPTADYLPHLVW